jgi:hypothetical protein
MQNSGWNPQRRNKNIGTAKSGFGQDNRMNIPESWSDHRVYWEKLEKPVAVICSVGGCEFTILVEPVQPRFVHSCTPGDIKKLLSLIPVKHLASIKLIVLRQPKRKERIMNPVWGRLQYWSEIERYCGPAVYLEAQRLDKPLRWRKSLSVEETLELERLSADGHSIVSDRRYHNIFSNLESIRATQLYRTLPHEIGHYVDYLESVQEPSRGDFDEKGRLQVIYDCKPVHDKEAFAHQYATKFIERQRESKLIPFERISNKSDFIAEGLEPEWFITAQGHSFQV